MSRPWVLVVLLLLIAFTSRFEWKQQFLSEVEANPNISSKEQVNSKREEFVKEKIILSQEKNIQKLKELVQKLQEELRQCRGENKALSGTVTPLTELLNELERQQILED